MNSTVSTQTICNYLDSCSAEYRLIEHQACRTSEESAAARAGAGFDVIGAKALVVKMARKNPQRVEANLLVLPGATRRINAKFIRTHLEDVKGFRFATSDEMKEWTGLEPGTMPPFAKPIFPQLNHLYVDTALLEYKFLGFNCACFTRSIIMSTATYIQLADVTNIFPFSNPTSK